MPTRTSTLHTGTVTYSATTANIENAPVGYYTFEPVEPTRTDTPVEAPPTLSPRAVRLNELYTGDLRRLLPNSDPEDVFGVLFGDDELLTIDRYGDTEVYSARQDDLERIYKTMKTKELLEHMETIQLLLKSRENSIYEEVE